MEKAQTETVCDSESSSTVSSVNRTDIDETSKEKEELFGAEEEGDDEDTLSDDSLRLRLSDDEDAEQDATTNDTNIAKLKLQSRTPEQPILDAIVEKTLCSDLQQTMEEVSNDSEEPIQEKHNIAIKIPENSALDKYTSEKRIQDNTHNSENIEMIDSESSEKCTFISSKDLKVTDVKNECPSAVSKQHIIRTTCILENDKINKIKETTNDGKEIMTNTCELNKLDNVNSDKSFIDSANIKICNGEKLSTIVTVSNCNDDNLKDEIIEKHVKNDNHSSKCSYAESNLASDVALVKSDNSNNTSSHKDTIAHKNKNKNLDMDITTDSKDTLNVSKITKKVTNISLIQNNSSNKDNTEVTNKDRDTNDKSVIEIVNNALVQTILLTLNDVNDSDNENGTKNVDILKRKRIKKTIDTVQDTEENEQEEDSGRQKRKITRNVEEIIRKRFLSDSNSNDKTDQLITLNNKLNQDVIPVPPLIAIKRNYSENEVFNGNIKRVKMNVNSEEKKDVTQLSFIEKFFRRDIKERLPKLTQEELEELLIQKIVETITMRSEIGQLREQARMSEKYQEVTRTRMQQLMKQVKDFEMVLSRNETDRRANPDKSIAPIKINRSVGLQVSFITEHGIQNLRQTANLKSTTNTTNNSSSSPVTETNNTLSPRRNGIKVRSPRPVVTMPTPIVTQSSVQTAPLISTVTPAALVVAKPVEPQHTLTLASQSTNMKPILSAQPQIQSQTQQTIVLNGKIQNQVNRPIAPKLRNSDLIDLTDEEEKNKSNTKVTTVTTTPIIEQPLNATSKSAQSFQRIQTIQTIPANVTITTQPTSIKVITTNQQPAPTALVNNVNAPRLAYVMQSGTGSPRQVLIASNPNQQVQIRPMNTPNRPPFSAVTYKGISTLTNGAVRLLTTPVLSNVQISKHPAPLPDIPNYAPTPGWKLPPPAPSLKISKVANGIVLSWNMNLSDKYADIASYQLYAYQEVAGVNPNTSLWKKVGDVRALPLPMACTLTQFSEGNNYYFAVRAVDTHSRKGQYSMPGNISL